MKPKFNQTTHMIEDLATLQVIAEPLRAQIFEVLANDMLTVRQVSERLGLTPSRLYYHINLLEQHGLIQVVETRTVMNMIEKVYQAVAPNLEVADALLEFTSPETRQQTVNMITSIVDAARDDLVRSLQARQFEIEHGAPADPRQVLVNRTARRIKREQAGQFIERIRALINEFEQAEESNDEGEDTAVFAMTVVFNPSIYYHDPKEEN